MAKNSVDEWSETAADNTDVGGIAIQGATVVSNFDNAMREMMAQIATGRHVIDSGANPETLKLKSSSNTYLSFEVSGTQIGYLQSLAGGSMRLALTGGTEYLDMSASVANFTMPITVNGVGVAPNTYAPNYESAQTAFANASTYTLTHGLGRIPNLVQVWIVAQVTVSGVASAGEWILLSSTAQSDVGKSYGVQIRCNAGSIFLGVADTGIILAGPGVSLVSITNSNWRLVVRAW